MPDTTPLTVVATFADRASAESAIDALTRSGLAPVDVHLHENGMKPRNAAGTLLDEYASGGFFTNFAHLLDGLLGSPRRSPSYEDVVKFEGVAVSVQVAEGDQVDAIEAQLRQAGAQQVGSGRGLEPS
jgi:hypothetical protein